MKNVFTLTKVLEMKLFYLLIFSSLLGCVQTTVITKKPEPAPEPAPKPQIELPVLEVAAPQNVVEAVRQILGDEGSLPNKKVLIIDAGDAKLSIPPGMNLDYKLEDNGSFLFSFNEPKPSVVANIAGFRVRPPVLSIRLNPDNTGVATVHTVIGNISKPLPKKFFLKWEQSPEEVEHDEVEHDIEPQKIIPIPEPSLNVVPEPEPEPESVQVPAQEVSLPVPPPPADLEVVIPEVWAYDSTTCVHCKRAEQEIASAKMPFKVVWKKGELPSKYVESGYRPLFWFSKTTAVPSLKEQFIVITGWAGTDKLIKEYYKFRGNPSELQKKVIHEISPPKGIIGPVHGIRFGIPWVEEDKGYTTVDHLIRSHGLTAEQLAPYANNMDALNRIHGWKHGY